MRSTNAWSSSMSASGPAASCMRCRRRIRAGRRVRADRWNICCPGGDSYASAAQRAADWLATVKEPTVAVSHGALGRLLRGLYAGLTPDETILLEEPQGCVFRLEGGVVAKFAV